MKKLLGILVISLLISGCATGLHPLASKYKPDGFGGGYSEQQVASDRYIVKYVIDLFGNLHHVQK